MSNVRTIRGARIAGIGIAYPPDSVTNDELARNLLTDPLGTSDDWIVQRTGIQERRVSSPDSPTSTWGNMAAARALAHANVAAEDVDLIITATVTPDFGFPMNSCITQEHIGATNAGSVDVNSACASFGYALAHAHDTIASRRADTVLVVGSDNMTSLCNWNDRNFCVLFGDAAGALVLRPTEDEDDFLYIDCGSQATEKSLPLIIKRAGGSAEPIMTQDQIDTGRDKLWMNGREVYRLITPLVVDQVQRALDKLGASVNDIDLFLFHQANIRIIDTAASQLGIPPERIYNNISRFGNTTSASIPLSLAEANEKKVLRPGATVMCIMFGAGFVWSIFVLRWSL